MMIKHGEGKVLLGLLVIISSAVIASCAAPTMRLTVLAPAEYSAASKLQEVAVLPFDGKEGKEFATELEGVLASINIGNKQYFALVDRAKIDHLLSEMKLGQTGLIDSNKAAKVGKMVGAKGIYTGAVTETDATDSGYAEKRTRCVATVTKYDRKGKPYEECSKYQEYSVRCTKRTATFAVTPKLIEVETSRVVYANNLTGSADSNSCSDSNSPLKTASELISTAKNQATAKLKKDIAPHYESFSVQLMDSKAGITNDDAINKFKQGIDFAKNNRFDRACELWGEARILSPNSPSIIYNIGLCMEVTGELNQAQDLYTKSDKMLSKPDDRITLALSRIKAAIEKKKKLTEQMK